MTMIMIRMLGSSSFLVTTLLLFCSTTTTKTNVSAFVHQHAQQPPLQRSTVFRTIRNVESSSSSSSTTTTTTALFARMPLPVGSLVALVTPMTSDGTNKNKNSSIDEDGLRNLLRWHKEEGTNGIVILGTTGEASTLTFAEKEVVMKITREEVGGILPIIVGTGTIDTQQTIAATLQAKQNGADAALIVTPYYVKPTQAGLFEHFTTIANAVMAAAEEGGDADADDGLPLILYNVPGRTGVDLSVETTVKLSHHPMIQGLKDATGDNNRVSTMRKIIGDSFRLYSGEDGMARDYVLQGGDGVISVTANVAPATVRKVMAAAKAGDKETAKQLDTSLMSLHRDLFCEANPIPVKWALYKMGKIQQGIRLPLTMLGTNFQDRLEVALTQASCIEPPPTTDAESSSHDGMLRSYGWPSRRILLQGQLFDEGLINQALEIIEKSNGDFFIESFSVQPNDQFSNADFNFKRPSSVTLQVLAVNKDALDDIIGRLETLVEVMISAEGVLTVIPDE